MKQSIIKISTPAPKVPDQTSLPEELPEPESTDMHQPAAMGFTRTGLLRMASIRYFARN